MTDVRVHTVGHILGGKYKDWYVFVQTYHYSSSHYLIVISNNKMFGGDEKGKRIEGSVNYDNWMPDTISLEHHFDVNYPNVEWLEDRKPEWLGNEAD